jgi:hypothetical protein
LNYQAYSKTRESQAPATIVDEDEEGPMRSRDEEDEPGTIA